MADIVSVVGMAGRFPGASDIDGFWRNLVSQQCLIDPAEALRSEETSRFFVPSFGRLGDVDSFDHDFFGLSPAEAYRMDPQMRLFLELCWNALEHSGDAAYEDSARIGLFAGAGLSTYLLNELEPARLASSNCVFREDNTLQQRLGNDRNYLTSTASYRFGFTGPSVTVQAACATSLVAVHYARQALLNDECDIAIAGGVSVIWPEPVGYDRPIFQEIGLGHTLGDFACSIAKARESADCAVVAGLRDGRDAVPETIANLFSAGYAVAWNRLNDAQPGKIVPLPGYQFQKSPIGPKTAPGRTGGVSNVGLPALGKMPPCKVQLFDISPSRTDWLAGHQVNNAFVVPGAGMLAMMLDFAASLGCRSDLHLREVVFEAPISMTRPDETCRIGLQIESGSAPRIALYALAEGATEWTRNAVAVIDNQADWPEEPTHASGRRDDRQRR